MPKQAEEEEEEKKGQEVDVEEPGEAPSEAQLEEQKQERDPDEAVIADQAIHSYVGQVLDQVRPMMEDATDTFANYLLSQNESKMFDNGAFIDQAGQTFIQQMTAVFGGGGNPIIESIMPYFTGAIDSAMQSNDSADRFANHLGTACRDASWFLRDNIESVLANQWDEIRDLAFEGSTEFIPLLHQFGLPMTSFSAADISNPLTATAESYAQTIPQEKEEAAAKEGAVDEEKKELAEEEQEQVLESEEDKKLAG